MVPRQSAACCLNRCALTPPQVTSRFSADVDALDFGLPTAISMMLDMVMSPPLVLNGHAASLIPY